MLGTTRTPQLLLGKLGSTHRKGRHGEGWTQGILCPMESWDRKPAHTTQTEVSLSIKPRPLCAGLENDLGDEGVWQGKSPSSEVMSISHASGALPRCGSIHPGLSGQVTLPLCHRPPICIDWDCGWGLGRARVCNSTDRLAFRASCWDPPKPLHPWILQQLRVHGPPARRSGTL